jgi:hypothetical protein
VEFPVTIIEQAGVWKTRCIVPAVTSGGALLRWLTWALDLGDPAAWHVKVRRRPRLLGVPSALLCAGDRLYVIRRH